MNQTPYINHQRFIIGIPKILKFNHRRETAETTSGRMPESPEECNKFIEVSIEMFGVLSVKGLKRGRAAAHS